MPFFFFAAAQPVYCQVSLFWGSPIERTRPSLNARFASILLFRPCTRKVSLPLPSFFPFFAVLSISIPVTTLEVLRPWKVTPSLLLVPSSPFFSFFPRRKSLLFWSDSKNHLLNPCSPLWILVAPLVFLCEKTGRPSLISFRVDEKVLAFVCPPFLSLPPRGIFISARDHSTGHRQVFSSPACVLD